MKAPVRHPWKSEYAIEHTEVVAESSDLRVIINTLLPGQRVPYHLHPDSADEFFCLEGSMYVETSAPDGRWPLTAGERCTVAAGVPHQAVNAGEERCRFLIVQGVGQYDYVPCPGLMKTAAGTA